MDPKDFKLQRVYIFCIYPESPIFLEKAGLVVNRHLHNYARFTRGSTGFYLSDEKEKIRVRLLSDGVEAQVESLSPEKFTLFSKNSHALLADVLEELGFSNVTEVSIICRYFKPLESPEKMAKALINDFMKIPSQYRQRFGGNAVDFLWRAAFPRRDGLEYSIGLAVLLNEKEVEDSFVMSAEECGRGGVVVRLEFTFPSEKKTVTLKELDTLFNVVEDEASDIASTVIESIKE